MIHPDTPASTRLLKGKPVLVMQRGHYPNRNDVLLVMQRCPPSRYIVRTEVLDDNRFAITAQPR